MAINQEIAGIFEMMADLYAIKGHEPWRTKAYQIASRAVDVAEDVKEIYKKKGLAGLDEIPGIGKDLSLKIEEYIKTGKIRKFEELKKGIDKGIFEMLQVEGLGPKKVKRLHDELGIKNLEQLKKAAQDGKISKLAGFGERSQQIILESLKMHVGERRWNYEEVAHIAHGIVDKLKKFKEIQRISVAGSIRRKAETVGDIDILASSKTPEKVIEKFVKFPEIRKVIAQGDTKASVKLKEHEIQLDLRVVEDDSFGSALQYFTGPKAFNIRIRKHAIKLSYKLSEYGLFDRKTGRKIAGKEESEIYKKLGIKQPKFD